MPTRAEHTSPMRDRDPVMEKLISNLQQQAQRTVQGFSQTFATSPTPRQRAARRHARLGTINAFDR